MMLDIMGTHINVINNEIFIDYYNYLKQIEVREREIESAIKDENEALVATALQSAEGQWLLMQKLCSDVPHAVIYHETSYGRPWTQCCFHQEKESDSLPDALFYRIDSRAGGSYFSVRQYFDYKKQSNVAFVSNISEQQIKQDKVERLESGVCQGSCRVPFKLYRLIDLFFFSLNSRSLFRIQPYLIIQTPVPCVT
jgi:hypothetical protein